MVHFNCRLVLLAFLPYTIYTGRWHDRVYYERKPIMSEINDYCPIVDEMVNVLYHTQKVPVLGSLNLQNGSNYIDECSHGDQCRQSSANCPIFLKLNKH